MRSTITSTLQTLESENGSELADENNRGVAYPRIVRTTVSVALNLTVPPTTGSDKIRDVALAHILEYGYHEFCDYSYDEEPPSIERPLVTSGDITDGHSLAADNHAGVAYPHGSRVTAIFSIDMRVPSNASDEEVKYGALTHLVKYGYHECLSVEVHEQPTHPENRPEEFVDGLDE